MAHLVLQKLYFSLQIFETSLNIKFYENSSGGSRVIPRGLRDRWTDRHDEDNGRFSKFCESA